MSLGESGERNSVSAGKASLQTPPDPPVSHEKFRLATLRQPTTKFFFEFYGPFLRRGQVRRNSRAMHIEPPRAAIYSRTLDDVSNNFPEVVNRRTVARDMNHSLVAAGD